MSAVRQVTSAPARGAAYGIDGEDLAHPLRPREPREHARAGGAGRPGDCDDERSAAAPWANRRDWGLFRARDLVTVVLGGLPVHPAAPTGTPSGTDG